MSMGVGAIRRTEAERIEYFNNQPDCSNIEPHNVTCTRCNKVVQLGRKQTYTVKPWETHRRRCDQMSGSVMCVSFSALFVNLADRLVVVTMRPVCGARYARRREALDG
jgi:hypothetical protein